MRLAGAHVRYEAVDGVGWITLARPQVLNALDPLLAAELAAVVAAARTDTDASVIAVTGEGRAFSSGMDRKALSAGTIGESFFRDWIRALNGLEDMEKLVLAAIRGYCIGGGLQLALACDLRLCAADAVLGLGATRHGLIPDGAVLRLARVYLEAQACARVLVASDIAPAREVVTDGETGLLFPVGDIDALTTQTLRAAAEPGLRARIGGMARRRVQAHGVREAVVQYAEALVHVARGSRA